MLPTTEISQPDNAEPEYQNERIALDIALSEMKQVLEKQFEGLDIFKDTAKTFLGASSIVIGMIGALQLVRSPIVPEWTIPYNILIGSALAMYAVMIAICLWVILPTHLWRPVDTNWDEIYEFFTGDEIQIYRNYLNAYTETIENCNPPVLRSRSIALYVAGILLACTIGLLVFLSMVPSVPTP